MNNILRKTSCVLLIFMAFTMTSCHNSQKSTQQDQGSEIPNSDPQTTYRLIVSFYSPGNGIDHEMLQSFSSFLSEKHPGLTYEKANWGKEGERDYCFLLNELNSKQQEDFIEEAKEVLFPSEKVRVKENQPCKHK